MHGDVVVVLLQLQHGVVVAAVAVSLLLGRLG